MLRQHRLKTSSGFTLIELVVVIVITGIIAAIGGGLIVKPMTGYVDLSRRTRLVDQAEMALRRMQRDIRHALPNSIRISGDYLELIHSVDGGRYRANAVAAGQDSLDFTAADNGFDVLGSLSIVPNATDHEVVVYNISSTGTSGNAYQSPADNVAAVAASGSSFSYVAISQSSAFANSSPYQRFFLIDGPVTYACEGNELYRYSGYSRSATQAIPPIGGSKALVAAGLGTGAVDCSFTYASGTSQRAGLVTLQLALEEAGERISLLHQVHVVNAP